MTGFAPRCDEEIIAYHSNGTYSLQEIADKFNCSRQWISIILKRNGVIARKGSKRRDPEIMRAVVERYNEAVRKGTGRLAALREAGVSGSALWKYAQAMGMELHSPVLLHSNVADEIAQLYRDFPFVNARGLGQALNLSQATISKILKQKKVKNRWLIENREDTRWR